MIKEQEAGMPTAEVCRRHALHCRVSHSDIPRVNISETHQLESLEDESGRLKRLLADTMLPSRTCFAYPAGQWTMLS
jgi:putative transposase